MLTEKHQRLTHAQRILLAEELWDSIADQPQPVTVEEVEYVKQRVSLLAGTTRRSVGRSWTAVKARLAKR